MNGFTNSTPTETATSESQSSQGKASIEDFLGIE